MYRVYFVVLLSVISFSFSFSQNQQASFDIRQIERVVCSFNSFQEIIKYKDWTLYQTMDDTWDGPKENICISLREEELSNGSIYVIDYSTVDISKPIFLEYENPNELQLMPDEVYSIFGLLNGNLDFNNDCQNEICSGIIVHSSHSDPLYTDTLFKTSFINQEFNTFEMNSCYVTEKTSENVIENLIYKMSIIGESIIGPELIFLFHWDRHVIDTLLEVNEDFYSGVDYTVDMRELANLTRGDLYLVRHIEDGLPSATNQSFLEIRPEVNKLDPVVINIDFLWETMEFQEFSHLIGGTVEGGTERHILNLRFRNSSACLLIVELIGTDGTNYILSEGGGFQFSDTKACLQLRNNSALIIDAHVQNHFGLNGTGNLNLRSGGSIELREGAEMIFDGCLILTSYGRYDGAENIHVDLHKDSHLSFTENVSIINNLGSIEYLYVNMLGGTIDLSQLSPEDQDKVILVYPQQSNVTSEIEIYPNPVAEYFTINNLKEKDLTQVNIMNSSGQLLLTQNISSDARQIMLSTEDLDPGLYFVEAYDQKGRTTHRLIVN